MPSNSLPLGELLLALPLDETGAASTPLSAAPHGAMWVTTIARRDSELLQDSRTIDDPAVHHEAVGPASLSNSTSLAAFSAPQTAAMISNDATVSAPLQPSGPGNVTGAAIADAFAIDSAAVAAPAQAGAPLPPFASITNGTLWQTMARFSIAAYDNSEESNGVRTALLAEAAWEIPALNLPATGTTPGGDTYSFSNGYFIGRGGLTGADLGSAFVARCGDTLVLSFEGTDTFWVDLVINDILGMSTAMVALRPLLNAIDAYTSQAANGVSQVYVTGHSLGGGLAQAFMMSHADSAALTYRSITFAAPGYNSNLLDEVVELFGHAPGLDNRITQLEAGFDLVPDLVLKSGKTLHFYNTEVGGNIPFWELHGKDRYLELATLLDAEGITPSDVPDSGANLLATVLGSSSLGWFAGDGDDTVMDAYTLHDFETMLGGTGQDTLGLSLGEFSSGANALIGGTGDDSYYVDDRLDRIVERSGGGHDSVVSIVSHSLAAEVEDLELAVDSAWLAFDANIDGTGNALANRLIGNNGNNTLTGLGGNDTLTAGLGNDVLDGGADNDVLFARGGADTLLGGSGNDSYDVMRVDYNPLWSVNVPTYTLLDAAGTADLLVLRDDSQGNLNGIGDLMFRAVGNDLWIDVDVDLLIDDDDDGRIVIQGQGTAGGAIESLRLVDEAGATIGSNFSLTSAYAALTATGTSNWFRLQAGAAGGNGLGLSVVAGSGVADGSGGTFVSGASQGISAGLTYTIDGQLRDIGYTTTHTITPAQAGALEFVVTTYSASQAGQYLLEVTDPNGRMLESFAMPSSFSSVLHVGVNTVGPHTVRLTNIGDPQIPLVEPSNGNYRLTFSQASTAIDYESEGNNSRADADLLALGRVTEGQLSSFNGDVDWYRVAPAQAGALEITLDGTYGGGLYPNLRMQVTDANGVPLENFAYLGNEFQRTYHVGVAGTAAHYIKVWHDPSDGAMNTQLYRLGVSQASTSRDYESEANNSLATADTVTLGRVTEGQLSAPGDVDWYRVNPAQAGALEIVLDGTYGSGIYPNLTLQVTDATGMVLESFDYLNAEFQATYHVGVAGTSAHYVKVLHDPADGAQNTEWYTVQVSQANTARDYESEPNDSRASADTLTLGRTTEGQLSRAGDVDWYRVTPAQAGALEFVLDGRYGGGVYPNLTLQVSDSAGTVLETFSYLNSEFQSVYHVGVAGTSAYSVKVLHDAAHGAQNTEWYELTVRQANTAIDYESEPNSTLAGADLLVAGRTTEGQLSSAGDVDWYRLNPATPGLLQLTVDGSMPGSFYPNLTLQLTDAAGTVQQTLQYLDTDFQRSYSLTLDSTAPRYIKVLHDAANGALNTGWYTLAATVTNQAPVLAAAVADRAVNEDLAWSYQLPAGTFTDPGDPLTLSATLSSGAALPAWLSFNPATRTFAGTPGNAQVGSLDITVRAQDAAGASATDTFRLTVNNVNDAPRLVTPLADTTVNEDSPLSLTIPAGLFTDDDAGDTLVYSASHTAPGKLGWLVFDPVARRFTGTPTNDDVGAYDITYTATDAAGATQSDVFRLTVLNTRDAPVTAAASATLTEDTSFTFTRAHFPFLDADVGNSLQALQVTTLPATGSLRLNGTAFTALTSISRADLDAGRLTYTPAANSTQTASFSFAVGDGGGFSAAASMTLQISNVNDAPLLVAPLLDQLAFNGRLFQYQVPVGAFVDPEQDAIAYQATLSGGAPLPAWLQFDNLTRVFSGTPGPDAVGSWSVQVDARDIFGALRSDVFVVQVDAEHGATPQGATAGSVGNWIDSTIDSSGDKDWFRYQLNAGIAYTIMLDGMALGSVAGLSDPLLRVRDATGLFLAENDDASPSDLDSRLVFTPATSGSYLVEAGGFGTNTTGGYRLLLTTANPHAIGGTAGADALFGTADADTLDGGAGADTMTGGDGADLYLVDNVGDQVVETNAKPTSGGVDTVHSSLADYTLPANVENGLVLGSAVGNLTGNGLNNRLTGNAASNRLNGLGGADTLAGGGGNDQYLVDDPGDVVEETAGGGTDDVVSSVSFTLASEVDHLTLVGAGNWVGTGNGLANRITGNTGHNLLSGLGGNDTLVGGDGNDTLDGGSGADSMTGGAGDDVYTFDNGGDVIVEDLNGGIDEVRVLGSHVMAANVENLRIVSSLAVAAYGNGLDNVLVSGAGDNTLNGGAGNDTADYSAATSAVTVSLAITAAQATGGSGSDTLGSIEHLAGSAFNDSLTGNSGANRLNGGAGNDTLNGGSGADTMVGGAGDDVFYFDNGGDVIVEDLNGGIDEVRVLGSHVMAANVENLRIVSSLAVAAYGNALDNVLVSGAGDNTLNGGAGNDTADYSAATSAVTVSMVITTAQATGGSGSDTLGSIEHLAGSAFNDSLTGNSGANRLDGGAGNDTLNGGSGADTMVGGAGDDVYTFDNGGDVIVEAAGAGTDEVRVLGSHVMAANVENLRIVAAGSTAAYGNGLDNVMLGNAGNDTLNGGSGLDTLTGGAGSDSLTGSSGADVFVLDSLVGSDTITDFASGVDKLRIGQAGIAVGNGDTTVNGAVTIAGPGGFATSAELVVVTSNIAGAITTASAAAAIGSASTAYAIGAKTLFAVDNGTTSALYLFTASNADALVGSGELTLLANLGATPSLLTTDLLFGP